MAKRANQNITEYRSIHDRAYDLLGEMLLERETKEILAEINKGKDDGSSEEMDTFYVRHDAKNLERINRYFRRQHARTFFSETLPKIGQIAAILIAVITVAGGVAIATSHTVRVQVMKLLVHMEEQYTELSLVENTVASFDIPAEWEGEYYPSFIPEGLAVNVVHPWPGDNSVEYINAKSGNIQVTYSEFDTSTEINIDTEETIVRDVIINGNVGFVSTKNNKTTVFWDNGRVFFVLITTDFKETTALEIAESVIRVK